jgi:hypothetical protein
MAAYDLVTTANVKSFLDIQTTTWDTVIGTLVTSCSVWIENYCGGIRFKNSLSNVTEYHDGDPFEEGATSIFLKNIPVVSVASIASSSGSLSSPTWTNYDASNDYIVNNYTGEVKFFALPVGSQNIKVVYQGGYTTIPEDLQLACLELVARVFNKRKSYGASNESVGGASVTWEKELEVDLRKTLNRYRNYAI